ncbi:hypothetical protein MTR67_052021 [Solanum verrucosum]|uniref:CBS domain-containing protein n=1 Tax=Solanum verrucosum TaxID=315347 RepID=A0AAF1A0M8_SOLVR|nr:hypothetical protein MTR67_052021 [Solanum verrucosum]
MSSTGRSTGPCTLEECGSIKVKCTWLVARKACSTHEALQKRGINIASRCLLCKEALETSKHLFLHCKVTTQVWALFTTIVGILWIMPEHTADLLSCWIRRGGTPSAFIETLRELIFKPSLSAIVSENTKVAIVCPSDPVYVAAKKMRELRVNSALITVGNKIQGILTSKDILMRVVAQNLSPELTLVEKVLFSPHL